MALAMHLACDENQMPNRFGQIKEHSYCNKRLYRDDGKENGNPYRSILWYITEVGFIQLSFMIFSLTLDL